MKNIVRELAQARIASSKCGADAGTDTSSCQLRIFSDTGTFEYTPVRYAAEATYSGKAVVMRGGISGLFESDGAELATNAETQALRQSILHPNLRIIFTVAETFYRIIGSRKAGIVTLSSLQGKRVGTIPGTSAAYYLDKMLRTVGLTDADVTIVTVYPLSRLARKLERGLVDAVTAWEPEPQNAADRIGTDAIEIQDRRVYREIVNLHATAETLAQPSRRLHIIEFVRALMAATHRFRTDEAGVRPFVAHAAGFDEAVTAKIWHNQRFPGTLVPDLLDVLETEELWVAEKDGRSPRTREELSTLIDPTVFHDAMALPVPGAT